MVTISDTQKIWQKIRSICVDLVDNVTVYDYLPPNDVEYPFIFIGEQFKQNYRENKDRLSKTTQITIHVYHNDPYSRGTLAGIMASIESSIIATFGVRGERINTQVLADNSTNTPLLHGIIEAEIEFY